MNQREDLCFLCKNVTEKYIPDDLIKYKSTDILHCKKCNVKFCNKCKISFGQKYKKQSQLSHNYYSCKTLAESMGGFISDEK